MPSTCQCDDCGLVVCAGWFHYHQITEDGFGAATLAYCAACGTCYQIEHATTRRSGPVRFPRSWISDGMRIWLGLGVGITLAVSLIALLLALRPPGLGMFCAWVGLIGLGLFLGVPVIGVVEILAGRSLRVIGAAAGSRAQLIIAGAVLGCWIFGTSALVSTVVLMVPVLGRWMGVHVLIWLLFVGPAVTMLGARALRIGSKHPTVRRELSLCLKRGWPRRERRPRLPPHPDRMKRQAGPVGMVTDGYAEPAFTEWAAFDPGSDVRPIRKKRDRGTLEGRNDFLSLGDVTCACCGVKGAIVHEAATHPCPRCRKGLLRCGIAWMT